MCKEREKLLILIKTYRISKITDSIGRKSNFYKDVDKSVVSSIEEAPKSGKTVVDKEHSVHIIER